MKVYLYVLIAFSLFLLRILPQDLEVLSISENQTDVVGHLSLDYQNLSTFSETISANKISETDFHSLFWEGLTKSYAFYSSSDYIDLAAINHLIDTELRSSAGLGHSFKKLERIRTNLSMAFDALNSFSGEWYGKWETMKVHHRWLPVRECNKVIMGKFTLMGFQSCYTGDGIGWNYLVKEGNNTIVLGFVYHFNTDGKTYVKNPHYAFLSSNGRLTWISDNHIYHEFICEHSHCTDEKHYVITGAKYKKAAEKIEFVSGFQAVYSCEDAQLQDYKCLF
jgi:hypothetical protein